MDISQYTLNPPVEIFEKLGQVTNTNSVYNQTLIGIKEKILDKFTEELNKAKSKRPLELENEHIRRCECAVKYLPETMKNALEVELRHCKDDIGQLIRSNENKLRRKEFLKILSEEKAKFKPMGKKIGEFIRQIPVVS